MYEPQKPIAATSVIDTGSLQGKSVIITGGKRVIDRAYSMLSTNRTVTPAARGLGKEYAQAFCRAGWVVVRPALALRDGYLYRADEAG